MKESIEYPGWFTTTHPMPPDQALPHKFFRDIKEAYEENGKEVLHVLSYFNSYHDPATCAAHRLYDGSMRDGEYGAEVIWRPLEQSAQ